MIAIRPMNKISLLQGYILVVMAIGILNHVIVIPILLTAAKRDAWLSVLAALAITPVWIACLSYIIKDMNGIPLRIWLSRHFGGALAKILLLFFSIQLFFMGTLSLKDTISWTVSSYLPQTPIFAVVLATVTGCVLAANAGLRSVAIVAGILLPMVIVLGDFVSIANFNYKNYDLLFPVMEYGMTPIWKGVTYAAGGILELFGLLFFQEHLSKTPKYWSLLIVSILLAGLIMGPLTGSIAIFGPDEAAEQRYPAFEQWRMVQLGRYLAHLDFFSIYQWLSGMFIRVSLVLFLIVDFWKPKTRWIWLVLTGVLMIVVVVLPISDALFVVFLEKVYFPVFLCLVLGLTVLFVSKIWISSFVRR
ncbi:hypothetical protein GCM10027018_14610 [Paenibacillus thermoaerophilus]